ncbi:hypothetical protein SDJN03_19508, partial [Cucurbita argyrosperma subsp. sororia]
MLHIMRRQTGDMIPKDTHLLLNATSEQSQPCSKTAYQIRPFHMILKRLIIQTELKFHGVSLDILFLKSKTTSLRI